VKKFFLVFFILLSSSFEIYSPSFAKGSTSSVADAIQRVAEVIQESFLSKEALQDNQPIHFDGVSAGIVPGDFFYFLENWAEEIHLSLIRDGKKRVEYLIRLSHERMEELKFLFFQKTVKEGAFRVALERLSEHSSDLLAEKGKDGLEQKEWLQKAFTVFIERRRFFDHNSLYDKLEPSHAKARRSLSSRMKEIDTAFIQEMSELSEGSFQEVVSAVSLGISENLFGDFLKASDLERLSNIGRRSLSAEKVRLLEEERDKLLGIFLANIRKDSSKGKAAEKFALWLEYIDGDIPLFLLTIERLNKISEGISQSDIEAIERAALFPIVSEYEAANEDSYRVLVDSFFLDSQPERIIFLEKMFLIRDRSSESSLEKFLLRDIEGFWKNLKKDEREILLSDKFSIEWVDFVQHSAEQGFISSDDRVGFLDKMVKNLYDCFMDADCMLPDSVSGDPILLAKFHEIVRSFDEGSNKYSGLLREVDRWSLKRFSQELSIVPSAAFVEWIESHLSDEKDQLSPELLTELKEKISVKRSEIELERQEEKKFRGEIARVFEENKGVRDLIKNGGDDVVKLLLAHGDEYREILTIVQEAVDKENSSEAEKIRAQIREGFTSPPPSAHTDTFAEQLKIVLRSSDLPSSTKESVELILKKITENTVNVFGLEAIKRELSRVYEGLSEDILTLIRSIEEGNIPKDFLEQGEKPIEEDQGEEKK
jgi:hypothetical protein